MLKTIKQYSSVAAFFFKMAIQRQLEYPSFLFFWFIGIPIQWIGGVWMIKVVIDQFHSLNGWTFPQIAFLYGLSLLSHGIMVVLFIQTWNIERMVRRGDFDRLLVRPLNVFFQFCFQFFNFIGLIDLLPGIIIFTYACKMVDFEWSIFNAIKVLLVLMGAVAIRASFFLIIGTTTFWTKSSNSLVGTVMILLERSTMYPLSIYPHFIQVIFTFVLPFGFISFYPANELIKPGETLAFPFGFALLTPVVGCIIGCLAGLFFKTGLKKYESAGS